MATKRATKSSKMGMNRTGTEMSPEQTKDMLNASEEVQGPISEPGDESGILAMRGTYIDESDRVGSVPVPGTLKGVAKTVKDKITGNQPEVLIDKLGQRLAFERSGVRLYDLFILKCEKAGDGIIPMDDLKHIRDEEAQHFELVKQAMTELGADPTSTTPAANVSGVASMGIVQVLADPRTSIPQCLEAILTAEMVDNAGWELLVELTGGMGLDETRDRFQEALDEEEEHLEKVKSWHQQAVLSESGVS